MLIISLTPEGASNCSLDLLRITCSLDLLRWVLVIVIARTQYDKFRCLGAH